MNIGTEIRQTYENALKQAGVTEAAKEVVYSRVRSILRETLQLSESRNEL